MYRFVVSGTDHYPCHSKSEFMETLLKLDPFQEHIEYNYYNERGIRTDACRAWKTFTQKCVAGHQLALRLHEVMGHLT